LWNEPIFAHCRFAPESRHSVAAQYRSHWAQSDILHCKRTALFDHSVGRLIGRDLSAGSNTYLLEVCSVVIVGNLAQKIDP
jgi:hypothetical protein